MYCRHSWFLVQSVPFLWRLADSWAQLMSEPEPAQGRPAQGAAATETDAPATETDARLFPDFTQHSFVRAQSNESCEPAPEPPARAGRRRGSRGSSSIDC